MRLAPILPQQSPMLPGVFCMRDFWISKVATSSLEGVAAASGSAFLLAVIHPRKMRARSMPVFRTSDGVSQVLGAMPDDIWTHPLLLPNGWYSSK